MTFNPNIPQPNDELSASQPVLLSNNTELDNAFEVDHYKFSDATTNKGKHREITTPNEPIPTTTTDPKICGHAVSSAIETLQFSKGINDAVPTPLTSKIGFISSLAPAATVNLQDFTGVTTCLFRVTVMASTFTGPVLFSGAIFSSAFTARTKTYPITDLVWSLPVSGNILQLQSVTAQSNVYWTIEFLRIE